MAVKGKCVCIILNKPERGEYYIVFVSICEAKVGELVWLNGVGFRQTLVMLVLKAIMTASKAVKMFPSVQKLSVGHLRHYQDQTFRGRSGQQPAVWEISP